MLWHTVELADHQKKALAKLQDGNILWGGVGSGKSRVGLAYYALTEEHEDIFVITTAKKRDAGDWENEAADFVIGKTREDTVAGVLTVDSWNNIEKYVDVRNAFFIFDEQRLIGSGKWSKSFLKIAKNNRWIMLSATPGDTWMDYIPVMIANGWYRNRTEFKREHVIYAPFSKYPKVERYVNVQRLVRQRNKLLVHMPYPKETVRHPVNIRCEYDEQKMSTIVNRRWNIFEDRPLRDVSDMFHVMRKLVNTDPSRSDALRELIKKHPRIIVFYNFDYELEILRNLTEDLMHNGDVDLRVAEWNGHKHENIPDSEHWIYICQYIAAAEGWNCTTTNAVAFWSLTYSYKLWEQAHGRVDRINTEFIDLFYYTFRCRAPIDQAIWRSVASKRNFQTKHFDMSNDEFYETERHRGA